MHPTTPPPVSVSDQVRHRLLVSESAEGRRRGSPPQHMVHPPRQPILSSTLPLLPRAEMSCQPLGALSERRASRMGAPHDHTARYKFLHVGRRRGESWRAASHRPPPPSPPTGRGPASSRDVIAGFEFRGGGRGVMFAQSMTAPCQRSQKGRTLAATVRAHDELRAAISDRRNRRVARGPARLCPRCSIEKGTSLLTPFWCSSCRGGARPKRR